MTRLEQQIQFLVEIDKVKNIFRQTYLADGNRKENDAEHSWHIALMAFLLKEHVEEPVDVMKVIIMVLIHDLVEIDAGDTYAYDAAGATDKREREEKAADRIFGLLPKDQGIYFRELWEESGLQVEASDFSFFKEFIFPKHQQTWQVYWVKIKEERDQWAWQTIDDQGHQFNFFWCPLNQFKQRALDWNIDDRFRVVIDELCAYLDLTTNN